MAQPVWDRFHPSERICLNLLLRCNLSCGHCNVGSNPHRRELLSALEVAALISIASRSGKRHITLSGGEPLLEPELTLHAVSAATAHGMSVDLESNAFWARTEEIAASVLKPLVDCGLSALVLSADSYHTKLMPLSKTIAAARAALALGILVEVNFCPSTDVASDNQVLSELRSAGIEAIVNPLLSIGEAKQFAQTNDWTVGELPTCDSLTLTVHADGAIYSCCEIDDRTRTTEPRPIRAVQSWQEADAFETAILCNEVLQSFYDPESQFFFKRVVESVPSFQELQHGRYGSICDFCRACFMEPRRFQWLADHIANEEPHRPRTLP